MLDLIIVYFKSIYLFLDNLEEIINAEQNSTSVSTDGEIDELIANKLANVDGGNLVKNLFSLKEISECEIEANM